VLWLILLLIFVGLTVVLAAGALFFQGYFYTEPTAGLIWRAPAAAAALTALFAIWSFMAYRSPGSYDALFNFTSTEDQPRPKKLWSVSQGKKTLFEIRKDQNGHERYVDAQTNKPWRRSEAVIIEEDGQEVRFDADRDADGNFKAEKSKAPKGLQWLVGEGAELSLRYRDSRGRTMTEDGIGQLSVTRKGVWFVNMLLNLLHFLLWFAVLWLLLRFYWSHALGLAFVIWLIVTIPLLPMLLGEASALGTQKQTAAPSIATTP
jgi:hypothetical protein